MRAVFFFFLLIQSAQLAKLPLEFSDFEDNFSLFCFDNISGDEASFCGAAAPMDVMEHEFNEEVKREEGSVKTTVVSLDKETVQVEKPKTVSSPRHKLSPTPEPKPRACKKKTPSSKFVKVDWSNRIPKHQLQAALHAELLAKYNKWRASQGLRELRIIYWTETEIIGWPELVQCKAPRTWSNDDMEAIRKSLPKISFRLLEVVEKEPPKKQRDALNSALHKELLKKALQTGYSYSYSKGLEWTKILKKFPSFKISNRDFAKWRADDRIKIKEILIDTLLESEINKSDA